VQLAVWTVSGFTFTWITQDAIKSAPAPGANRGVLVDAPPVSVERAMQVAGGQAGAIERVELPADLVGAVMFLSSPASDFMTGQTVNVDGGKTMH
jgi:3-oxoacyl-[acyl-carrier protein] reductase